MWRCQRLDSHGYSSRIEAGPRCISQSAIAVLLTDAGSADWILPTSTFIEWSPGWARAATIERGESGRQLPAQDLVHQRRIAFAAGRPHHLADEEAEQFFPTAPEFLHLVR